MKTSLSLLAILALLATGSFVNAQTWIASGNGSWNNEINWSPATVPNATGATATFNADVTRTVNLDGGITVGSINYNTSSTRTTTINNGSFVPDFTGDFNNNGGVDAADFVLWRSGAALENDPTTGNDPGDYAVWRSHFGGPGSLGLTFDAAGAGPATLNIPEGSSTGKMVVNATFHLHDNLVVTLDESAISGFDGALRLYGAIDGPGGFTRTSTVPGSSALMNLEIGAKTYTGPTVISAGRNRVTPAAVPVNSSSFTLSGGAQFEAFGDGVYQLGAGTLFLNADGSGPGASGIIRPSRDASHGYYVTIPNKIVLQSDAVIHSQSANGQPTTGPGFDESTTSTGFIKLSGDISGSKHLEVSYRVPGDANTGSYYLQGHNTFTGGLDQWGGKLIVGGDGPDGDNLFGDFPNATLGAGDVTIHAGAEVAGSGRTGFMMIDANVLDAINDSATLTIKGSPTPNGVADDGYVYLNAGIDEKVGHLVLGTTLQAPGTYGATGSGAAHINDEYFAGSGIVTVLLSGSGVGNSAVPEPSSLALVAWLGASFVRFGRRRVAISK